MKEGPFDCLLKDWFDRDVEDISILYGILSPAGSASGPSHRDTVSPASLSSNTGRHGHLSAMHRICKSVSSKGAHVAPSHSSSSSQLFTKFHITQTCLFRFSFRLTTMDPLHATIENASQEELASVLITIVHDGRLSARDIAASLYKAPHAPILKVSEKGRKRSAPSGPSKPEGRVAKKAPVSQSSSRRAASVDLPEPLKCAYEKCDLEKKMAESIFSRDQGKWDECYRCSRKYPEKDNYETSCSWHPV